MTVARIFRRWLRDTSRRKTDVAHPGLFPAKAGPTMCARSVSGTGFSREEASTNTPNFAAWHPTPSRLKPVPQYPRGQSVGPASAGRGQHENPRFRCVASDAFPAKAGPTMCTRSVSGTGFSREETSTNTRDFAAWHPTPSRLKAVLQCARGQSVGLALAGKRPARTHAISRRGIRRLPG